MVTKELILKKKIIFKKLKMIKVEVKREAVEAMVVKKISKMKVFSTEKMKIRIWKVMTRFSTKVISWINKIKC